MDCIDRKTAIEAASEECGEFRGIFERIKERLEAMPSAHAEHKTGKWVDETYNPCGNVHFSFVCDQCGGVSEWITNFCPHCGADMRETKEI